jgi:membrane protease subunit (stomatin/prohibitin family)
MIPFPSPLSEHVMDFMKIITKQLIEIIEWTDDSRDTLSYRWPDEDKEIKNGAQLIVRESQQVQFVSEGQFADLFNRAHLLTTQNIPILSTMRAGSTASTRPSSAMSTTSTRACSPATNGAPPTPS